jgi:hypothetical protein
MGVGQLKPRETQGRGEQAREPRKTESGAKRLKTREWRRQRKN